MQKIIEYAKKTNVKKIITVGGYSTGKISDKKKRLMPYVRKWINNYNNLSKTEKLKLKTILMPNDMEKIIQAYRNIQGRRLKKLLEYHIEAKDIVATVKK